jgi:hypothetical protein
MIDLWMDISMQFHMGYQQKRLRKNMTFNAMTNILKFSQHFIQGLWEFQSELFQLPHVSNDNITQIQRKMKKKDVKLLEYISLTPEERKEHDAFPEKQLKDVESCIKSLPKLKLSAEIKTQGVDDLVVLDLVTIKITIERTELDDDALAPPVCSRAYPFIKNPRYFVFLTDVKENNIFAFMKTKEEEVAKVISTEIKFQAPPSMVGNC